MPPVSRPSPTLVFLPLPALVAPLGPPGLLRLLGLLALLGLLLTACTPGDDPATPLAWERFDLWVEPPTIEEGGTPRPLVREIGFLGAEEVRDLERVPESQLAAFPVRRPGQVRTLEQRPGSRLAWEVDLGRRPHAAFVPLGWDPTAGDPPCRCRYRFGLRDTHGQVHELWSAEARPASTFAPVRAEVDLTDFAGTRVTLLFQVDALEPPAPGATVAWGSPAAYWKIPRPAPRPPVEPGVPDPPNVLLLGLDTLRADAVGALAAATPGAPRQSLTPSIDRLAADSDLWTAAYATFSNTNPSFASIHTGLYGKNHGVYDLQTPLPDGHRTLAEIYAEAGYDTLAVVSAHHLGDHNSGLGQGFDEVVLAPHTFAGELPVDLAVDWIGERQRPFFLWLHLFDPHTPHTPPQPWAVGMGPATPRGMAPVDGWTPLRPPGTVAFTQPVLAAARELYDAEVAYMDRQVGRLMDYLASRGLLENTVVALVADHGESLGEHGIDFRHVGLWEVNVRVPLLVRWPGPPVGTAAATTAGGAMVPAAPRGRRFDGLVQTLDLFPTLLAAAGLAPPGGDGPDGIDGVDLRQLTHDGRPGRRAVFAEHNDRTDLLVRTRTHAYFESAGNPWVPPGPHLYDLVEDPAQTTNLAGRGLPVETELAALLDRFLADRRPAPETTSRTLTPEETERLRSLGYLQ